jgi:hypothetical protein
VLARELSVCGELAQILERVIVVLEGVFWESDFE